jgi:hypothetical protein
LINALLAAATIFVVLLPILTGSDDTYIVQYRANLGLDAYLAGSYLDILSFGIFAVIIYVFQFVVSKKLYTDRKGASLSILTLATILLVCALIVVNSLLELR